jgi:hypothetical protein
LALLKIAVFDYYVLSQGLFYSRWRKYQGKFYPAFEMLRQNHGKFRTHKFQGILAKLRDVRPKLWEPNIPQRPGYERMATPIGFVENLATKSGTMHLPRVLPQNSIPLRRGLV